MECRWLMASKAFLGHTFWHGMYLSLVASCCLDRVWEVLMVPEWPMRTGTSSTLYPAARS